METRTCSRCGEPKPCTLEFFPQRKNRRGDGRRWDSWCRECYKVNTHRIQTVNPSLKRQRDKEWREKHSEQYKARRKALYARRTLTQQQRQKEYHRTYHSKVKLQVITAYGGQCECCAENLLEFLTIDHRNRDGKTHRGERNVGNRFYRRLIAEGFPRDVGLRVLCMNCNWASAWSIDGKCPHERFAQGLTLVSAASIAA